MRESESLHAARTAARAYESALPPARRKQLGQYFSGIPLGKLLAHLALNSQTRTVLDPMAGHGDLLDAVWDAARERGIELDRLDAIEIDDLTAAMCRNRLAQLASDPQLKQMTLTADAFDPVAVGKLPLANYDLVITNPPYVRYQSRNANGTAAARVRSGLVSIISSRFSEKDKKVWIELAKGYSGLADLSVPAWLLAATMVRPGGRLALIVPAAWRSRNYADVLRYLLLRCFCLEYIVEDEQPGWFSDALVRTHLLVARRLSEEDARSPITSRTHFPKPLWLQVASQAASSDSLVGANFSQPNPESSFASWVQNGCAESKPGITVRPFNLNGEWSSLEISIQSRSWYERLEPHTADLPLFLVARSLDRISIPDVLKTVLPEGFGADALVTLEDVGVTVGQGLRTGCNGFFYVTSCDLPGLAMVAVETSAFFGHRKLSVPASSLKPVLRRQSEITSIERGQLPPGRVLDLRGWVLPEDFRIVAEAEAAYGAIGEDRPQIMPDQLAEYVRSASALLIGSGDKLIPELSAVRTNVRIPRNGQITPRFWYMLPNFANRHLPAVFVPRINHGLPWAEANTESPLIIDANFSTFTKTEKGLTRYALKALLNSVWCRAFMEALGTPLGGGALKLEATHLRRIAVPFLSDSARTELSAAGSRLTRESRDVQAHIDSIVLDALLSGTASLESRTRLANILKERASIMSSARRAA